MESRATGQGTEMCKWSEGTAHEERPSGRERLIRWERDREIALNGVETIILGVKQPEFKFKGHYSASSLP